MEQEESWESRFCTGTIAQMSLFLFLSSLSLSGGKLSNAQLLCASSPCSPHLDVTLTRSTRQGRLVAMAPGAAPGQDGKHRGSLRKQSSHLTPLPAVPGSRGSTEGRSKALSLSPRSSQKVQSVRIHLPKFLGCKIRCLAQTPHHVLSAKLSQLHRLWGMWPT